MNQDSSISCHSEGTQGRQRVTNGTRYEPSDSDSYFQNGTALNTSIDVDIMKFPSMASAFSYPLNWIASAGSPCGWFSSPEKGVRQSFSGRVRPKNDIRPGCSFFGAQGFHESDRSAYIDISSQDENSTKPINRAQVHPLSTGSIDSQNQTTGETVLGSEVQPARQSRYLQFGTQHRAINDPTYCCEDIKQEWIAAGLPPRFAARVPAGLSLKKFVMRGEYGIVESDVLERMEMLKAIMRREMDIARSHY